MTVGDRIKSLRISNGWTQQELANRVGYKSKASINKLETCRDMPLDKVRAMAKALGVSESYLMGWTEDTAVNDGSRDATLIRLFHSLSDRDKEIVMQMMRSMAKAQK